MQKISRKPCFGFVRKNKIVGTWLLEKVLINGIDSTEEVRKIHKEAKLTLQVEKITKGDGKAYGTYKYNYTTNSH